jgi:phospholipase/carboxylesterase
MTARFSSESFEHSPAPVARREAAFGQDVADLLPSVGHESLLAKTLDEPADLDGSTLEADDTFVPDHYEPNYAYPLIVWLAPPGAPRRRLQRLMRTVSERNYFGVTVPVVGGDSVEEQLFETFVRLRQRYHLHTERVYLLGFGDFGTQALKTALCRPAWFAGVAAISARWPESPRLLAQYDELRGKRMLLGIGENDSVAIVSDALYMQQLLWSAGMHVTALAAPAGGDADQCLLREVDRWIMQGIEQPELVC